MAIVDQSLTRRARAALLDRARALRAAQFGPETSRGFTSQQIRHGNLKETLSTWLTKTDWPKGQAAIYVISAVDVETVHRIVQALPERDGRVSSPKTSRRTACRPHALCRQFRKYPL